MFPQTTMIKLVYAILTFLQSVLYHFHITCSWPDFHIDTLEGRGWWWSRSGEGCHAADQRPSLCFNICEETSGQFSAVAVTTKPEFFSKTSGHLQPCLWWPNQTPTKWLVLPDPNQTISKASSQHNIKPCKLFVVCRNVHCQHISWWLGWILCSLNGSYKVDDIEMKILCEISSKMIQTQPIMRKKWHFIFIFWPCLLFHNRYLNLWMSRFAVAQPANLRETRRDWLKAAGPPVRKNYIIK